MIYNKYSDSLKSEYGEKVYKIPINLPVTCPNRDGNCGVGGCIFCGEDATGFESQDNSMSVKDQMLKNIEHISKKYAASKYIAYFQNFTNTYMPINLFKDYISAAVMPDVVEIAISTRPDCISEYYLEFLKKIEEENNVNITIELGLQSINHKTLVNINRGHTLAEYIDSVLRIRKYKFKICTHLILNLPWDDMSDVIESAKIMSAFKIDYVKLHSLYMVKNTVMEAMYKNNDFELITADEYKERVIIFLEYLDKDIVIQRLISRAPKEDTSFVNWHTSWWKIRDEIEAEMTKESRYQGRLCDYLNGRAVRKYTEQ